VVKETLENARTLARGTPPKELWPLDEQKTGREGRALTRPREATRPIREPPKPASTLRRVSLDFALALFDGEGTAVERYAAAKGRSGSHPRWTEEIGFVEHHRHGHLTLRGTFAGHYLDVDESDHVSQKGAGEGAVGGGLVGVLGGPPGIALGLLVGGVIGSQAGDASDTEAEPRLLADQLRAAVPRSSSAIVLIAQPADVDEMLAALSERAKDVIRRTLTVDQQAGLQASLSAAPPASP
jgi:uncharacterized membrane protein